MATNPLTDDEPEQTERTKTSDYTGLTSLIEEATIYRFGI